MILSAWLISAEIPDIIRSAEVGREIFIYDNMGGPINIYIPFDPAGR